MRVTNRMMTNNALQHLADLTESMYTLSERINSDKLFQNASDDPVGASLALNLQSTLRTSDGYRNTASLANDWMNATEFALQEMETQAIKVENLIQRALNDTFSGEERVSAMATELEGIIEQMIDLGNTKHNGQSLFAGYKVTSTPFLHPDRDTIVYDGDDGVMYRSLGPSQSTAINVTGHPQIQALIENMIAARNALEANDMATLRTTLSGLQSASEDLQEVHTTNGARLRQVQVAVDYLDKVDLEVKSLLSQKQDANMAEAITLLRGQEVAYQSVLEVSRRAISALSLFDYLR